MRFGDFDGLGEMYSHDGNLILNRNEKLWMTIVPRGHLTVFLPTEKMKHRRHYVSCQLGVGNVLRPSKSLKNIDRYIVPAFDQELQVVDIYHWGRFPTPMIVTNERIVSLRCAHPTPLLLAIGGYWPGPGEECLAYEQDIWRAGRRVFGEVLWNEIERVVVADWGLIMLPKPEARICASYEWRFKKRLDTDAGPHSWIELGVRYPNELFQLKTLLRIMKTLRIPMSYSGLGSKRWHDFHSMFHFEDAPLQAGLVDQDGNPRLAGERVIRRFPAVPFLYWPRKMLNGFTWRRWEFWPAERVDVVETNRRFVLTRERTDRDTRYREFGKEKHLYLSIDKSRLKVRQSSDDFELKLVLDKRNRIVGRLARDLSQEEIEEHEKEQKKVEFWFDKMARKYRQPVGATRGFSEIPFPREAFSV